MLDAGGRRSAPAAGCSTSNSPSTSWYAFRVVGLLLIVIIIAAATSVARLAVRPPQSRFGWSTLWRLACLIGAARITVLWIGYAAYSNPGTSQGLGYLLLLTGLPEIYLVRGARADPVKSLLLASELLAASSLGWAALLVWAGNRIRPRTEPQRHGDVG